MPIIPSVFQPIKQNDVQQRPIKAYKRYNITSDSSYTSNGYFVHKGVFDKHTPHIFAETGQGVGTRIFPINSADSTNQHVIWNTIDHRYYRNYAPESVFDFIDINDQDRFLSFSASVFTAPYGQVGEQIKRGSSKITSSIGGTTINLFDDSNGNLRDAAISTSSFASSSRNIFYMSFNNMYKRFNDADQIGNISGNIPYELNHVKKEATATEMTINTGITITGSGYLDTAGYSIGTDVTAGAGRFIRIPHNDKFDRFGRCDDWTISFWHKAPAGALTTGEQIISKWGMTTETFIDKIDGKRKLRDVVTEVDTGVVAVGAALISEEHFSNQRIRTPFNITCRQNGTSTFYECIASDGKSTTLAQVELPVIANKWNHVLVRNKNQVLTITVNDQYHSGVNGTIPDNTINAADIIIGDSNSKRKDGAFAGLAELRMYDYAVDGVATASLADNDYFTPECFQTNVAGNVFYKNGQMVLSSVIPKYNSGSGMLSTDATWNIEYRGVHTLYENEVLVRIPKDTFNVTMNPTSTFRPLTVGDPCLTTPTNGGHATEEGVAPGELRKSLFVSGTLKPYITTIGLYNDQHQMLATAKLSTPVQKLDDVDMNFIVRWDY